MPPSEKKTPAADKTKRDKDGSSKAKSTGKKTNREGGKTKRAASASKQRKGEAGDGAAQSAGAPDADAAASESTPEVANKRPAAASLKTITTGSVAAIDFIEDDEELDPKPGSPAAGSPEAAAAAEGAEGAEGAESADRAEAEDDGAPKPVKQVWQCSKWLTEIKALHDVIAAALCTSTEGETPEVFEADAALAHVRVLESRDQVVERLAAGGALDKLADIIWPKVEILQAGPATAAELASQWHAEGAGSLLYGDLPAFFQGLEPRIGSPDPKVLKDMAADHCSRPDAQVEFTTGNYSVVTTSEVEWKFVYEPETPLKWPIEERLMGSDEVSPPPALQSPSSRARRSCLASPCLASPCLALPRLASPRLASELASLRPRSVSSLRSTCASSCPRTFSSVGWRRRTDGSRRWVVTCCRCLRYMAAGCTRGRSSSSTTACFVGSTRRCPSSRMT